MKITKVLFNIQHIRRFVPMWLKSWIRRNFNVNDYDKLMWAQTNPYKHIQEKSYDNPQIPFTLGIMKEFSHEHKHYIAACQELEISFKVIDISSNDWIEKIEKSSCDAFCVWPSPSLSIWKQLYDERVKIIVEELNKTVYPSYKEIWIYESKRRMRDWLVANHIPHPKTDIFYELEHAVHFIHNDASFPIVLKLNHGATATGVFILNNKRQAERLISKIFKKGITVKNGDPRDIQWGNVILQEYLPNIDEWRMVRVGDSYFGHKKGMGKQFHSGSGNVIWDTPSDELLNFTRMLTDIGNFTSMDVDIFETKDNKFYVNELQTVFSAYLSKDQLKVNGKIGRFIYDNEQHWKFEEGDFARNACTNLRIEHLVNNILKNGKTNNR